MEAWQKAKDNAENVPKHDVKIRVMTVASAGGMTTAMMAMQFFELLETSQYHDNLNMRYLVCQQKRNLHKKLASDNLLEIHDLLATL